MEMLRFKKRKPYIRPMENPFKKFLSVDKISNASSHEIPIWPYGVPGSEGRPEKEKIKIIGSEKIVSGIHQPSIIPYLPAPEIATGTAVIIAPGGGHKELWIDHEGHNPARIFCDYGIAAFVLKYRLAEEVHSIYSIHEHALADMQQAIRFVRYHAEEWKINTARIGVMGFSAGGEIAALAAMHFDEGNKNANDKISEQSAYPNFQALIYPAGTKHFKVLKNSPPLFLLCGDDDKEIAKGVAKIYQMYKAAGIPAELHNYPDTGHGFGVRKNNHAAIAKWPERFVDWLSASGFIKNEQGKTEMK
jgi:acetyl esterase/lipase